MPLKLTTTRPNYRAMKIQIAAKYSGADLQESIVDKVEGFGKYDANGRALNNSVTAAIQVSNEQLLGGQCSVARALVQQYAWAADRVADDVFAWVLTATGLSDRAEVTAAAKDKVMKYLNQLNRELTPKTFLVGERITLADIVAATTVLPAFVYVLTESDRKNLTHVERWFTTVVNQKEVAEVVGKVELCSSVPKLSAADAKKEKPKKEKEQPKEAAGGDLADDLPAPPKEKDPFAALPKGNFDFDDFKRFYSNNDCDKSIPYFWEKFDKENYSIWFCEYKYPEDLTQVFMSCNLISGMMQRLDKMRKASFGSMCLFGEDNNSTISGIWVWRGHGLAFELSPDWQVDYNSYTWQKLDPEDAKTKTLVQEYFSWEGNFDGKKFNQGKIFK